MRFAYIAVLCGLMAIATASVSAGEERAQESRPRVELSAGTWISVGDTRWAHNASSVPGFGNPTSKLTYKDVGTNVIDLAGKVWFSPKVFGRLSGGFANIGGGRLTDDDYGCVAYHSLQPHRLILRMPILVSSKNVQIATGVREVFHTPTQISIDVIHIVAGNIAGCS